MKWLFSENGKDLGLLILRIGFGLGMVYHGYGKVMGGATGTIAFAESAGFPMPVVFGWAGALSEFLGGIGLLLGLLTRPSALFVSFTMVTAAFVRHLSDPFSEKELALAYLVAALCLLVAGAGQYSLDNYWFRQDSESTS
ncbi:MAG: DoxX family protein [bacterium]